ncbi:hypothetical protein F3Y22_tig00110339pilonHSYRG00079 [Hibiscus syriacus]|uniref:Uncharacterized protein n=1 Tax=Hibiscus syriacus TaxID=106335 RepID=A0A6A3AYA0_HIBSY|nr:uncharacterized protein LOC120120450 [Hibiscus syriacus]KAE8708457.1 hypothetical protein F3Y22_tig00110339pilonHSYRG00079 [Hibiscus syriacus]
METVAPVPAVDFNFDSTCSSPFMTAPSTPQRFGNFFLSAPTSPTHVSSLYPNSQWDETPRSNHHDDNGKDFEFNFSGPLERAFLSADELFDGGKIRPLLKVHMSSAVSSACNSVHKKRRSLSPLRACDFTLGQEEEEEDSSNSQKTVDSSASNHKSSYVSSILSSISFTKANRKWKLKDLFLFRSASEGRAASKDPLRKYALLSRKDQSDDVRNASFRSTVGTGSVSRRGAVSAHELHYTANRAVSEEMKKKTFLPYKQGLLGCLGFNPGMNQISRGIGSLTRG